MSETTHAHAHNAPANPLLTPQSVERNGVTEVLQCFTGKRGVWDGKHYQAPQIETDGTDSSAEEDSIFMRGIKFVGKVNIQRSMNIILRRFGQDFVDDAIGAEGTPNEGIFNLDVFLTRWTELRASALKLSELNEAYQTQVNAYTAFTSGELLEAFGSGDSEKIEAAKIKMKSMASGLAALKAEYEERKARRSKEAAAETASPE